MSAGREMKGVEDVMYFSVLTVGTSSREPPTHSPILLHDILLRHQFTSVSLLHTGLCMVDPEEVVLK